MGRLMTKVAGAGETQTSSTEIRAEPLFLTTTLAGFELAWTGHVLADRHLNYRTERII